jgi:hypothetical protein
MRDDKVTVGSFHPFIPHPLKKDTAVATVQAITAREKSSAWDFFYARDMALACFVSYWVTTHVLSPFVAEPDAVLPSTPAHGPTGGLMYPLKEQATGRELGRAESRGG